MLERKLQDVHVTILAGGSGTRLWPKSRHGSPKQFLSLVGERSMLQQTIDRVLPLVSPERIYVLTGPDHAPLIEKQIDCIPGENIMIEFSPRGTAPCLGLAAMRLRKVNPGSAIMVSLHADHAVRDETSFRQALVTAVSAAQDQHLVTIGIVPDSPDTGFGYIERGETLTRAGDMSVYRVARFTEKPPLESARRFVESGRYYWNSGYFAWTLERILGEFKASLLDTYLRLCDVVNACDAVEAQGSWEQIERATIDVGIMEKAADVAVVPASMGWSDVGSWSALYDILAHDAGGNVVMPGTRYVATDSSDSLILADGKLVATIGVENLVIVDTEDVLLVLPRDRAQDVGRLVKELRSRGLEEYL